MKKRLLYLQAIFYIAAGCNHFRKPDIYNAIIPPYFPAHQTLTNLSGIAEIILGSLLLFSATRKAAAWLIFLMLIVFIPCHIYYIQVNSCLPGLCFSPWVGWVRLLVFQPLLMAWAWWYRK